jgi:hypothetical protein
MLPLALAKVFQEILRLPLAQWLLASGILFFALQYSKSFAGCDEVSGANVAGCFLVISALFGGQISGPHPCPAPRLSRLCGVNGSCPSAKIRVIRG